MFQAFVVPPRHVDIPVLPCRFGKDSRLLFSLCRSCALKYKDGHTDPEYVCPHVDDSQRGHVGTYTDMELGRGLRSG